MKNNSFILFLIIFASTINFGAFCQKTTSGSHLDLPPMCVDCPDRFQILAVSADKKLDSVIYQQFNSVDMSWKTMLKSTFAYNSDKKLTEEKTLHWKGKVGGNPDTEILTTPVNSSHKYSYDKNGHLIEDLFSGSVFVDDLSNETEVVFTYAGWSPVPVISTTDGGYKVSRKYDSNGNISSILYQNFETGNYVNYSQLSYSRDSEGKITKEDFSFIDSTKTVWIICRTTNFIYDEKGVITQKIIEKQHEPDGELPYVMLSVQVLFTKDASGRQTEKLFQQMLDSKMEDYKQEVITYDAKGDSVNVQTLVMDGGTWYKFNNCTYKFNSSHQVTELILQKTKVWEWDDYSKFTYTYDKKGNLTKIIEMPLQKADGREKRQCLYYYGGN